MASPLPDDEIQLILMNLKDFGAFRGEAAALLSPDERERADRFKARGAEERFLLARGLLRRALGGILGEDPASLRFSYGPKGKPRLEGKNLSFNLAHSADRVAIAVAKDRDVGIDLERIRPENDALVERYFSAPEAILYRATLPEKQGLAFFHFWTAKEAYLKARGDGLSRGLKSHSFSDPWENPPRLTWVGWDDREPARWSFHRFWPAEDCIGTLAYAGGPAFVKEIKLL
ncbi:MAG TPA: 4'-phosphopantetheinyl transferase superfamily protein [bacterium]|nr:4'-phosphopantetheinyl transferase superfamily protein [bacterium]